MKKSRFYLVILLSVFLLFSPQAKAQLAFGISFDFVGDAVAAITPVFEQIQTFKDQVISKVKEKVSNFKASLASYFKKRNKVMDKIPGTKDFAEKSSVDIYNSEAVEKAVEELFLQYPSADKRINAFYEKEGQEFYYDTLIEVYTATQQLETRLDDVRQDVDKLASETMTPSSSGDVANTDDENGNYYNLYLANKAFNDTLKITQEVMAMYSQFYVAQQIYRKKILPQPYVEEKDKDKSKPADDAKKQSSYKSSEKIAFAQFVEGEEAAEEENEKVSPSVDLQEVSALEFSVPEDPDLSPALYSNIGKIEQMGEISSVQKDLRKAIAAHNTLQLLSTYREYYIQYDLFAKIHEKARQAVELSDKCVLQYLGRRYSKPERVWYGSDTAPISSIDYDARKGISGWAVSAYTLAQAQKSTNLDVDSFSTIDLEVDLDNDSLNANPAAEEKLMNMNQSNALANPSKEQAFSDSIREIELLTWQIGSQASKILAADQYSSKKVFGDVHTPYPIWRDQKSFYKQYLDGKYENMKKYVKQMNLNTVASRVAMLINEEKYQGISLPKDKENKARDEDDLERLSRAARAQADEVDKRAETIIASKKEALASLSKDEAKKISGDNTKKAELQEELDNITTSISFTSNQISEADSSSNQGRLMVESSHELIVDMNKREAETDSILYMNAQSNFAKGKKQELKEMKRAHELRLELDKLEAQRDEIIANIKLVDAAIAKIKEDFVNKKSLLELQYDAQIEALAYSASNTSLSSLANSIGLDNTRLRPIISHSDHLIGVGKDEAARLIDRAQDEIRGWGDSVYDSQNHERLLKRHTALINSLKRMSFSYSLSDLLFLGGVKPAGLTDMLSTMLQSKLVSDICSKYTCNEPDVDYFVGAPAKARDFTAPRTPLSENYPPLRDIFHFDITDYKSLDKAAGGVVLKSSMLNYGGDVPAIWTRVLSGKAYVEKDVNLSSFLEQGGENEAFMRGVKYPCRYGKYAVDINANGRHIINFDPQKSMPQCTNIVINSTFPMGSIDFKKGLYTITDLDAEDTTQAIAGENTMVRQPSELGTILRYMAGINPKLRVNNAAYNTFENLIRQDEKAQKDPEFKYKVLDLVQQQAVYNTNQVGNFLHIVDKELNIRKSRDEMAMSIEEANKSIKQMLSEIGFELPGVINLANEKEYNTIARKLKDYKSEHIAIAASKLSSVDSSDRVLKERYDKVDNIRLALIQDSKAVIALNDNIKAGASLSEKIITEEANQKVIEKTRQAGYDALRKEANNFEKPLCVAY